MKTRTNVLVLSYSSIIVMSYLSYMSTVCPHQNAILLSKLILAEINPQVLELPLYCGKVSAGRTTGFASPAQDYEQERLDLNKRFVTNKTATVYYYVGKSDDSMIDEGILPDATLIVDKSKERRSGKIVVAVVDGEFVVKKLYKHNGVCELHSRNAAKNYPAIQFDDGTQLIIEGVVTFVVNPIS